MGQSCCGCCRRRPPPEAARLVEDPEVPRLRTPSQSSSVASCRSTKSLHGRQAYSFKPPSFEQFDEPEYLISTFPADSFEAAQNLVDLFQRAKEDCEKVRNALSDCMKQLGLQSDAPLSSCIAKMKQPTRGYRVEVDIEDAQPNGHPPQLVLPERQNVRGHVILACDQLNEALRLSFEFANDERHATLDDDKKQVESFKQETDLLHKAIPELRKYADFSADVKRQADCFISDFVDSYNHRY